MYSHVGLLDTTHSNGKSLQFSTTELRDFSGQDDAQIEGIDNVVNVVPLTLALEHFLHRLLALDGTGNVINILGLDEGFEIILEDFGKVILQLGSSKVFENLLPIRRVLQHVPAPVSHHCCTLGLGRLKNVHRIVPSWA